MMNKLLAIGLCITSLLCLCSSKNYDLIFDNEINGKEVLKAAAAIALDSIGEEILNGSAPPCACGSNSDGCKLIDGRKVCSCKQGFAQGEYGLCVETCNETKKCENGGSCLQHVCVCLPGTRGPFCKTIDDCASHKLCADDKYTSCEYNTEKQKAYCRCSIYEYRFDEANRTCRDCECTYWARKNPEAWSYCEYRQGMKICTCRENFAYNPKLEICEKCECGQNSKWCEFDANGNRICGCEKGYLQFAYDCRKCDCGKHGFCKFSNSMFKYIDCFCDPGYVEFNQSCEPCTCGKYGKCVFNKTEKSEIKQVGCECQEGYEEKSGKCEMCYCGENSKCAFTGKRKVCTCPEGFKDIHGFCEDLNECKEHHNPCKDNEICINTLGSYMCKCDYGYKTISEQELLTCQDIDECESTEACMEPDTECINTLGSFMCVCKHGFISRGGTSTNLICEKNSDSSIYTLVGITALIGFVVTVGFILYVKQGLRSETGFRSQEMR